jgi:predicted secreted protein
MPAPDLDRLAAEVADLHADALHAARVERVCRVAAGQRLLEIRSSMGADAWSRWIAGGHCPVIAATAAAYVAAAEQHAEQVQELA